MKNEGMNELNDECFNIYVWITGSGSSKTNLTDDPTWIVDPIDGTLNFVHAFPHVAVSIGVTYKKKPVVGVIYNPILDHMYAARDGRGATLNGTKLSASKVTSLGESLMFLEMGYSQDSVKQKVVHENFHKFLPQVRLSSYT
jgi:myo-inositol-1(or 4)-monophosphatase